MKIRCFEEEDVNEKIILTRFSFQGQRFFFLRLIIANVHIILIQLQFD